MGGLRGWFGYNAITRTVRAIFTGNYAYPPNFDEATGEICKERARIWELIPMGFLNTVITNKEWRHQWKCCCKSTLSLESGLHFSHCIAGICSDHVSYFYSPKATLILQRGVVLECWACGLLVMLEKMLGCALITNLCSILLMEVDFNAANKIIYTSWFPKISTVKGIGWRRMVLLPRLCIMILCIRLGFLGELVWLMWITATTTLHT